jgi:hypothetical protein
MGFELYIEALQDYFTVIPPVEPVAEGLASTATDLTLAATDLTASPTQLASAVDDMVPTAECHLVTRDMTRPLTPEQYKAWRSLQDRRWTWILVM